MATKKQPRCTAKTKSGTRCRRRARKGSKQCAFHDPVSTESHRFGTPEQAREAGQLGGRPRKPRPDDILRERIEADIDRWLAPLEAALGSGKPVQMWDSARGSHEIEYVIDPALGMKAMKLAFERVYGKPRQSIDLAGADGGVLKVAHVFEDDEIRGEMHGLLSRVAAARPDQPGGAGSGG